ncbi:UDP-N-acetylglucosamine transporter [Camponotus floridanus]|uniref:UDP-N-acetylglucosamine transporter n=1 Tax=Camponotus floridanus TaxID=104421 RepID=E2AFL1_CAMFO|nr:UDP-N-acetylglucosamine transporter [Camponotus floridanus]
MNKTSKKTGQTLKYVSLITLTLQNAMVGLSMRYSRTRIGDMFLSSTAVVMAEVVKLFTCLILVYIEEGSFEKFYKALHMTIVKQPIDTLKVTYQLKILTTAFFAIAILRKTLRITQWSALVLLVIGVVLVQLAQSVKTPLLSGIEQNHWLGFSAALSACFLSGFAGIYFEKILKGSDISVWMRNVQLSVLSIPFGLGTCFLQDGDVIYKQGFFFGYDLFIFYLVILQAGGGLIVAMVVKYADNILKGFATSLAIIISCIASIYLFNFQLSLQFTLGAFLVICSIFLYGHQPKIVSLDKHTSAEKV